MRQKRAKSYKKQMNVYLHTFKFREPYQTIVDDELILLCEKAQFDIVKGLERTVQGEVKPMITQCCVQALYKANNQGAISIARGFERRRCNHQPSDPATPEDCILSITNVKGQNKHRYVVAAQNLDIRKKLRKVPGVPMIFMNRSVMCMEPISKATTKFNQSIEDAKLTGGLNDVKYAGIKKEEEEPKNGTKPQSKKRKGPAEPNPLSMKRKKPESTAKPTENSDDKKKRRRKNRATKEDEESQPEKVSENNEDSD